MWFDAHDDFNTPDTVMSGYFDSQPIASVGRRMLEGAAGNCPGTQAYGFAKESRSCRHARM